MGEVLGILLMVANGLSEKRDYSGREAAVALRDHVASELRTFFVDAAGERGWSRGTLQDR